MCVQVGAIGMSASRKDYQRLAKRVNNASDRITTDKMLQLAHDVSPSYKSELIYF